VTWGGGVVHVATGLMFAVIVLLAITVPTGASLETALFAGRVNRFAVRVLPASIVQAARASPSATKATAKREKPRKRLKESLDMVTAVQD